MRPALLLSSLLGLSACIGPPNPGQKLSDAAHEMNTARQFGRLDIALGHVGPSAREAFVKRQGEWSKSLRLVDVEFAGMSMGDAPEEATVQVNIIWQRHDEAHIRVTQLSQRWKDERGTWFLVSEETSSGDAQLLKQPRAAVKQSELDLEAAPARSTSFRTRVIRAD